MVVNKRYFSDLIREETGMSTIFFSIKIIKSSRRANKCIQWERNLKSSMRYTFQSLKDQKYNT